MYSFMGGGLFCAWVGTILLVVATATDHWMQYRLSGSFAHQGLWRYCLGNKCFLQTESIAYWNATRAFMILSALCATSGIIMGVLAFAQQSAFTRLSRPFSAGIMFFASKLKRDLHSQKQSLHRPSAQDQQMERHKPFLSFWPWPFTPESPSVSSAAALGTGAFHGLTSWAGWPCS
ncbi:lens fiber membrane intrinsic protein isoform X3 [Arvicanthis niloticus]